MLHKDRRSPSKRGRIRQQVPESALSIPEIVTLRAAMIDREPETGPAEYSVVCTIQSFSGRRRWATIVAGRWQAGHVSTDQMACHAAD